MNSKSNVHVDVTDAFGIERPPVFILFFVAFANGLYQIFLLKQLSITNFLGSQTITINIVVSLTLASLGLGAYATKFLGEIRIQPLLAILLIPLAGVNIFILKYNFGYIGITDIAKLTGAIAIFSSPVVIMGIIFAKIYLRCIQDAPIRNRNSNNYQIGIIVLMHTAGFILGTLSSIVFIKLSGANILLLIILLLMVVLILYIWTMQRNNCQNAKRLYIQAIFVMFIACSAVFLIYLYDICSIDQKIERQRNNQYLLWPQRAPFDETFYSEYKPINKNAPPGYLHLYSGWSAYSKIDIFSWEKDCIGGAYNYKQQWIACPDVSLDYDVRQLLYAKLHGKVLLIGTGGGIGCAVVDAYKKSDITCIEIDPLVVNIMKTKFRKFNRDVYNTVDVKAIDGRFYLDSTHKKFDYIVYEGTDFSVATKVKSLIEVENYLYTYEGIGKAIDSLAEDGALIMFHGHFGYYVFDKLKKALARYGIRENQYIYYNFVTNTPVQFSGKLLIISKDEQRLSMFKDLLEKNSGGFKEASFNTRKRYRLITDDNPFLYLVSDDQMYPFLVCTGILFFLAGAMLMFKRMRITYSYFFILGLSFILVELFVITVLRALFFDYITTYVIANAIIMVSFSCGSLFYAHIKKIYLCFPFIAMLFLMMIYNIDYSWSAGMKLAYLILLLSPLFIMMGSYFPLALSTITKKEFPFMYLLDSVGSAIGFFMFYSIAILAGIKYNFILAAGLYTFLSVIARRRF